MIGSLNQQKFCDLLLCTLSPELNELAFDMELCVSAMKHGDAACSIELPGQLYTDRKIDIFCF